MCFIVLVSFHSCCELGRICIDQESLLLNGQQHRVFSPPADVGDCVRDWYVWVWECVCDIGSGAISLSVAARTQTAFKVITLKSSLSWPEQIPSEGPGHCQLPPPATHTHACTRTHTFLCPPSSLAVQWWSPVSPDSFMTIECVCLCVWVCVCVYECVFVSMSVFVCVFVFLCAVAKKWV
jgi:hypothetical protein